MARSTRFGVVASFLGRRAPLVYEGTDFEPGRRLVMAANTNNAAAVAALGQMVLKMVPRSAH